MDNTWYQKSEPPSESCFDGDIACAWKKWKQHFEFFISATQSDEKDDKIKTCILLSCIGSKGCKVYGTFDFAEPDDAKKLNVILEMFDTYCQPKKNITISQHKFFTNKQQEGQTFSDFVTALI